MMLELQLTLVSLKILRIVSRNFREKKFIFSFSHKGPFFIFFQTIIIFLSKKYTYI